MKYYVIAGEASGDLHASNLMRELRRRDPSASFRCWGGDLMQQENGIIVKHYREMAYMGFVEVLTHLPAIFRNIRQCKQDLLQHRPDVLILVDFPGFNLRIAEFAKQQNIPVFYYISPKIWAWNQKRVLKIKRVVDKMFCILPFEVDFYRRWGMEVDYVGNPLADAIAAREATDAALHGDQPLIALLPGSRKQEITRILPEMLRATDHFKDFRVVIAGAPAFSEDFYRPFTGSRQIQVVFGQTYDLLRASRAALVTSGTATLETALLNVPQAVLYKANALSVAIARRVIKVPYISLVNLIAGKEIVKELIQETCNEEQIAAELGKLLHDEPYRNRMLADYEVLRGIVGGPGASTRAAEKMLEYLSE
ncbi:lipid-A-disaccharide synthase [Anseongella ginsenosidimutans]|uniref:Lipid-A-disaccharide synthase n=1 Tax=Anseongella ginsenosidimutans TaxID=496056 RepID=A0A4R3KNG0_9SPHI|nr:lipid-A-disaccharide synthase [Anseongella ginsenosidimutans]QEC52530.1 lipid-A-disaccharide synthase [Anseongella ginsenosidimutans]TCS85286.1 lipid-A-disaccharide synthase [Anseongella ginsenosidimutans]